MPVENGAADERGHRDRGPAQDVPSLRTAAGWRWTGSTWWWSRARYTDSSARTAPARPPRCAPCSGWSGPTAGGCGCSASRSPELLPRSRTGSAPSWRARSSSATSPGPHAAAAGHAPAAAGVAGSTRCWSMVGLRDRGDERVKGYSLGMKQRLAVASALLKDPRAADPRRAGERARPGRHPGDAGPDADARRHRDDRADVQPHPGRDPADLRPRHDHLPRPAGGRRPGGRGAGGYDRHESWCGWPTRTARPSCCARPG